VVPVTDAFAISVAKGLFLTSSVPEVTVRFVKTPGAGPLTAATVQLVPSQRAVTSFDPLPLIVAPSTAVVESVTSTRVPFLVLNSDATELQVGSDAYASGMSWAVSPENPLRLSVVTPVPVTFAKNARPGEATVSDTDVVYISPITTYHARAVLTAPLRMHEPEHR
jgi:hypothetical protein